MLKRIAERVLYIRFALAGVKTIYQKELNVRVLTGYGVAMILSSWLCGVRDIRMGVLLILFAGMIALEFVNSSVERLCNMIQPNYDARIKAIKDISSAGVFLPGILLFIFSIFWIFKS